MKNIRTGTQAFLFAATGTQASLLATIGTQASLLASTGEQASLLACGTQCEKARQTGYRDLLYLLLSGEGLSCFALMQAWMLAFQSRMLGLQLVLVLLLTFSAAAQTGGTYDLSHSVIATGGGSNSSGGTYRVDGTIGQPIAGTESVNTPFSLRGGFWAFQQFAPTAAGVSISGGVTDARGRGIRNIIFTLAAPDGSIRSARSATFGYFRFDDVPSGQTYVLTISAKRYIFADPIRVIAINDDLTGIDFIALPL
ncbi:MAG: carboxypeptidase-like regulatory domain-containing protein [Pyrinomonadaceae bacterium]